MSRRGILLVLSGPSGTGKGTVGRRLREMEPEMRWSVSWATRPARPGEIDGVDYHFVEREEFERARDDGGFLEWFEVFGDLKGTPAGPVREHLAAGRDVLLEVDVQGALAIRDSCPEALLVFLRPPSREVQRARIVGRGQDSPEAVERRLAEASAEEAQAGRFDAVVVNDDLETAVSDVAAILRARREGDHDGPAD
ncbi:MAG: guanylate kinase [Acidimicrobiia bacterium]|nr:guanylate kinase [Acidimicrobiia bacterium]